MTLEKLTNIKTLQSRCMSSYSVKADLVLCKPLQGAQLVEAQHEKWRTAKIGEKCCTEKRREQAKPHSLSPAFFLSPFFHTGCLGEAQVLHKNFIFSQQICISKFKKAFKKNISKMQLMERDATRVLACNVVFLVIMNGECFLVIELGTDVFHVWNFIYM